MLVGGETYYEGVTLTHEDFYRSQEAGRAVSTSQPAPSDVLSMWDKLLEEYDSWDVYVIGGESVYRQLLPYCDVAHVTRIDHAYESDAFFPDLDQDPEWEITADSDEQTYFDIAYQFLRYERRGGEEHS